jgi:hypothetical protein
VQGRTEPATEVRPLERTIWVTREDGLYATCNVFYRRSAFDHAGGFDRGAAARLGFRPGRMLRDLGMGEDTLLGWRVRRQGRSAFVPEAVVRHHVFPRDVRHHVRRALSAGGFPMLVREVPELRTTFLSRRVVLGAPTRLPLYAAVPFVALRQWRAAIACLTAWVVANAWVVRRSSGSTGTKAASLPAALVTDAVTAASLLAGSTRARTLVL